MQPPLDPQSHLLYQQNGQAAPASIYEQYTLNQSILAQLQAQLSMFPANAIEANQIRHQMQMIQNHQQQLHLQLQNQDPNLLAMYQQSPMQNNSHIQYNQSNVYQNQPRVKKPESQTHLAQVNSGNDRDNIRTNLLDNQTAIITSSANAHPVTSSVISNHNPSQNPLESTAIHPGSHVGHDLRPSVKVLLRRKVWSHGHEVMLAEAIAWANKSQPRNLWTRIRKDPRYFAVLGHYNGAEMASKWNSMIASDMTLNNLLAIQSDNVDPVYLKAREAEIATSPLFSDYLILKSTDAEKLRHEPLEDLPIGASGCILPHLYGPEYGACDSDSDDETTVVSHNPDSAITIIATQSSTTLTMEEKHAILQRFSPAEISAAQDQLKTFFRGHRVQTMYEVALEQIDKNPENRLDKYEQEKRIESINDPEQKQLVEKEFEAKRNALCLQLLNDVVIYLYSRNFAFDVSHEIHAPAVIESSNSGPTLIAATYHMKSLKTFLVNQCGMELGLCLSLLRELLVTTSHYKRRQLLSKILHSSFNTSSFARYHFRSDIRGGSKHKLLKPHPINPAIIYQQLSATCQNFANTPEGNQNIMLRQQAMNKQLQVLHQYNQFE